MAVEAFRTTAGARVPAVTSAQMAEIDRIAIDNRNTLTDAADALERS